MNIRSKHSKNTPLKQGFCLILVGVFLFSVLAPSYAEAKRFGQSKDISAYNLRARLKTMEKSSPAKKTEFKQRVNSMVGFGNQSELTSSFLNAIVKKYQSTHDFFRHIVDLIVGWRTKDWRSAEGSKAIGKQAQVIQVIERDGKLFMQVSAAEDPSNVLNYVELEKTPLDVESALQSFINWRDEAPSEYELLKAILSYLKGLPVPIETYTFSTLVRDLEGYASAPNNLIALHKDIAAHPLALLHELGEYMVQIGALQIPLFV